MAHRTFWAATFVAGGVVFSSRPLPGDEPAWRNLRINEVISDNVTQGPADMAGNFVDMVEIYNAGDETVTLGSEFPDDSIALTDWDETDPSLFPSWSLHTFRRKVVIAPRGWIVVFCDENRRQDLVEPHAWFRISSRGEEPITLWSPVVGVDDEGNPVREVIDRVWLPPLREDSSFGRFPDGAGPAPVPLEEVLETFVFYPPGQTSFGECVPNQAPGPSCPSGACRDCRGAPNGPGGGIRPRVEFLEASTNRPAAGEGVVLRVKVEDEKSPTPPNIARVQAVHRAGGGPEEILELSHDAEVGIRHATMPILDSETGRVIGKRDNPFKVWTEWVGEIPGRPAGTRVDWYLRCEDADGLVDTSPQVVCPQGMGPCDVDLGGPGCERNPEDIVTCSAGKDNPPLVFTGVRYRPCREPFSYVSGYEPPEGLRSLRITEVVALAVGGIIVPHPQGMFSDFIEIHNGSDLDVDLSGLWLSSSRFSPRMWQFPPGSTILPQEYLLIWLDERGGKCPCDRPPIAPADEAYCNASFRPCTWRCPDPTDVGTREYHASFSLDHAKDRIYLRDREERGFGIIHGTAFEDLGPDHALALLPGEDGGECWIETDRVTPGAPNEGVCPGSPIFLRGDSNSDCSIDIADGIFTLEHLFRGGSGPPCADGADADDSGRLDITDAVFLFGYLFLGGLPPPAPGPEAANLDPTEDDFPACEAPRC